MTQKNENIKRRNAFFIMADLIGLVKPLIHIMIAAVILGTAGYLCAIFLTILAGQVIIHGMTGGNTWLFRAYSLAIGFCSFLGYAADERTDRKSVV